MGFTGNGIFTKGLKWGSQIFILYMALQYYNKDNKVTSQSWIDLTHPFNKQSVYYPGNTNYNMTIEHRGNTSDGIWYESNSISLGEHGGTHCDAPSHFYEGNYRMHEVPVERFNREAVIIDISQKAASNPDAQVTLSDILQFEKEHGQIPAGAFLFMYSGWDKRWPVLDNVLGNAKNASELHFPGFHPELAYWLVSQRNISAVGVDSPSVDYGPSTLYEVHRIIFKENIFAMENVKNLGKLPPTGSMVYAFPMNIEDGSGAPCRIIAALPPTEENTCNWWINSVIFLLSVPIVFAF